MAAGGSKPAFVVFNSGGPFDIVPYSAKLILGQYTEDGWNHGKRVYRRVPSEDQKFLPDVKLFFWDETDGKDLAGWWFGGEVGRGQVWAHNASTSPLPPEKGWQCPADGPVVEHILCVPPVSPPKPVFRVKIEEADERPQVQLPGTRRRWGSTPSCAPPAKRPKEEFDTAKALVLRSDLGQEAPWGTQHLLGEYVPQGQNHGRTAFCRRRDPRAPAEEPVWLYYWDFRDGRDASGWWLGKRIGGRERFGRAEQHEATPPLSGWRVPPDGVVRQDLNFTPQGQPEHVAMPMDKRLAAATATVEGAEVEAFKALEASQSALDEVSGIVPATLQSAIYRLQESAVAVEEALASMGRHERAARTEPGGAQQEMGPLRERLQVLLESVQQELSRATWRLDGLTSPPLQQCGAQGSVLPEG